jgi:hypothetical protein
LGQQEFLAIAQIGVTQFQVVKIHGGAVEIGAHVPRAAVEVYEAGAANPEGNNGIGIRVGPNWSHNQFPRLPGDRSKALGAKAMAGEIGKNLGTMGQSHQV